MEQNETTSINIIEVLQALLKKWWIIILSTIICASLGFFYAYTQTTQQYTTSAKVYVNSSAGSISVSDISISSGAITANRSLVDTYAIILKTRLTLEDVIEEINIKDAYGFDKYDYDDLCDMIGVSALNSTEVMGISVTGESREDIIKIANTILEVFPRQVKTIINGSSAEIVDYAVETKPLSRGFKTKTILGGLIGAIISMAVIFISDILINDTIESADWIKQYLVEDAPLLSVIPEAGSNYSKRSYRYNYKKYGYGYGYGASQNNSENK